jgi:polyhydroxyalkanoate synthesis regulator phasin
LTHRAGIVTDHIVDYDGDSPTEESRRFRRELLRRIQEELFTTAAQAGGAVEQNLLRQVAGIIRRCEDELLNTLYPTQSSAQEPSMTNYSMEGTTTNSQPTSNSPSSQNPSARRPSGLQQGSSSAFLHIQQHQQQLNPDNPRQIPDQSMAGQQYLPDVPNQGSGLPWDSSEWIDWNAVFPPGPEIQGHDRGEPLHMVAPVWT